MKRSPMPPRKKPMRQRSERKRQELVESRPIVAEVLERDGGCVLRTRTDEWGPCDGPLDPHHLLKAAHGGEYSLTDLVCLCRLHNGAVEDHPAAAKAFGLVVNGAISHAEAAHLRRARGLVAPALPTKAMGLFTLGSIALVAAVCWGLLALGGCAEGDAGQVCREPNAADCPSNTGGEVHP
jgi:hypothetical protein